MLTKNQLIDQLFEETKDKERCLHLERDKRGLPYCTRGLDTNTQPGQGRYLVCDPSSLQLFCLDSQRATICIYHQGETLPRD